MDEPAEKADSNLDVLHNLVLLASEIFNCQIAAISSVDKNVEAVIASVGLFSNTIPINLSLTKNILSQKGIFVLSENEKPPISSHPSVRFYAGVSEKVNLSSVLCIVDVVNFENTRNEQSIEMSQIGDADVIITRKVNEAGEETTQRVKSFYREHWS